MPIMEIDHCKKTVYRSDTLLRFDFRFSLLYELITHTFGVLCAQHQYPEQ